ncbi:DUF2752 domain-containing protein [Winogradskyella maritima]|uniref:DUF2752 domain-containing protein n=1 Tax=Winogradskyella maritima TaxID=1517766 RepID=A0ABV8AII1_9FLAO
MPKTKTIIHISIAIVLISILSLYFFIDPSDTALFPKCPFLSMTNLYCPGCGSQRAVHDILQGNILEGFRHNYLFLLLGLVLGYQFYIFLKSRKGQPTENLLRQSKVTRGILILVILFWILRNIPVFPFTELAP